MRDTILLVEDGADDRLFMSRAFTKAGMAHLLQMVNDGRQAIAYLTGEGAYADREKHPIPRIILLDLKMRQLTGFDVLKWIREQAALVGVVVIVLTSSDRQADIQKSYELGANSFLSKPAAPDDLLVLVREVVNYWLKNDQSQRPKESEAGSKESTPDAGD